MVIDTDSKRYENSYILLTVIGGITGNFGYLVIFFLDYDSLYLIGLCSIVALIGLIMLIVGAYNLMKSRTR